MTHKESVIASPGAFFYGTLLHPKVLKRVINNDGKHLYVTPAILLEHTRHRIEGEDYPGILPYSSSRQLFNRELTSEERSVRGTLVLGLNEADIKLLDDFEGDEYVRKLVSVHPLRSSTRLDTHTADSVPVTPPSLEDETFLAPTSAYTYIWTNLSDRVVPELWSYEAFMKDNAWKWTGEAEELDNTQETVAAEIAKGAGEGTEVLGTPSSRTASSGGSTYFAKDQIERRRLQFENSPAMTG